MTCSALWHLAFYCVITSADAYLDIAGYEPGSDVTQHNRLDLDQQMMESYLGEASPDFTNAKGIYEGGAHSGAYARMTVSATSSALDQGAAVTQGSTGSGYIKKSKVAGVTEVDVTYSRRSLCGVVLSSLANKCKK